MELGSMMLAFSLLHLYKQIDSYFNVGLEINHREEYIIAW